MFQVIIPALKAAAPAAKFAAGVFGATLVMAFSGVAYYGVARTGIEAVDQRIANKRAARATREAALKDIRNYVNSEIQRQVDAAPSSAPTFFTATPKQTKRFGTPLSTSRSNAGSTPAFWFQQAAQPQPPLKAGSPASAPGA